MKLALLAIVAAFFVVFFAASDVTSSAAPGTSRPPVQPVLPGTKTPAYAARIDLRGCSQKVALTIHSGAALLLYNAGSVPARITAPTGQFIPLLSAPLGHGAWLRFVFTLARPAPRTLTKNLTAFRTSCPGTHRASTVSLTIALP
jgi:hypothetical protein